MIALEVMLALMCLAGGYQIGYRHCEEKHETDSRIEYLESKIYEIEAMSEEPHATPISQSAAYTTTHRRLASSGSLSAYT